MNRQKLSSMLHELCRNVYFQPPPTILLKYPCIVYERTGGRSTYADDNPYSFDYVISLTYIDPNPDSVVPEQIAMLPMCKMDRCFTHDNLNHTVFTIRGVTQ